MPSNEQLKEADRVMRICNACRYCEGFCAVYPAMELRRTFTERDLRYLANLCHNCRDCYYACQYAPPHEFNLNVPRVFAELRLETYQKFTWPRLMKGLFKKNGLALSLVTVISTVLLLLLALAFNGPAALFSRHLGQNAFYQVIPYNLLVILFSAIGVYTVIALLVGMGIFWKKTAGSLAGLADTRANARAVLDALQLKYLDGGGFGCNYPDHRFSHTRRWFHHLVFYGFILCFCSTVVAAIYDHFMNWPAPIPLLQPAGCIGNPWWFGNVSRNRRFILPQNEDGRRAGSAEYVRNGSGIHHYALYDESDGDFAARSSRNGSHGEFAGCSCRYRGRTVHYHAVR